MDGQSGACAAEPEIAGRALKRELTNGVRSAVGLKPPPPWLCFNEKRALVKAGSGCSGKSLSGSRVRLSPRSGVERRSMPLQTRAPVFSIGQFQFNTDGEMRLIG